MAIRWRISDFLGWAALVACAVLSLLLTVGCESKDILPTAPTVAVEPTPTPNACQPDDVKIAGPKMVVPMEIFDLTIVPVYAQAKMAEECAGKLPGRPYWSEGPSDLPKATCYVLGMRDDWTMTVECWTSGFFGAAGSLTVDRRTLSRNVQVKVVG
jgi:hypothetical protein